MDLPAVGDRIRSGSLARVVEIEEPNEYGNVRCLVKSHDGRLGWIVYYADGGRSNVNFFPTEEARVLAARLLDSDGLVSGQEDGA